VRFTIGSFTIPIVKRSFLKLIFLNKKSTFYYRYSKKPIVKRIFGKIDKKKRKKEKPIVKCSTIPIVI
jgi:hypothetical protein